VRRRLRPRDANGSCHATLRARSHASALRAGGHDISGPEIGATRCAHDPAVLSIRGTKEIRMAEFALELWAFMKERKKFWLLPIIAVLLLFGGLILLTQGSAVAPFIYTLF